MILIAESPSRRTEYRRYLGNAGLDVATLHFRRLPCVKPVNIGISPHMRPSWSNYPPHEGQLEAREIPTLSLLDS